MLICLGLAILAAIASMVAMAYDYDRLSWIFMILAFAIMLFGPTIVRFV